ncbi:hypothetical protein Tco_0929746, partial [Tanacetum coccineum]
MANLEFCDKHNMIAYLQKSKGSDRLATARTSDTREVELTATIDGQEKTITEASLRRHLKLEDNGGVTTLPNSEIFEKLALIGYATASDKLTFQKGLFWGSIPLFASMITESETSPLRITSSPSLSPQHTPFTAPSTSQPSNIHTTPVTEEVKKLEQTVKTSQSRRRTRVVLSNKEEVSEDPSKQRRSLIEELDLDAKIYLVPPHDAEIQEKISNDTKVLLEEEETVELVKEPTKLVEDHGSGEKGEQEVTTADIALNTASVPISTTSVPISTASATVSTAAANLVYIRRIAEKRKDKGKSIMIKDESVQKKSKKQLKQERLSHEEAIRL